MYEPSGLVKRELKDLEAKGLCSYHMAKRGVLINPVSALRLAVYVVAARLGTVRRLVHYFTICTQPIRGTCGSLIQKSHGSLLGAGRTLPTTIPPIGERLDPLAFRRVAVGARPP